MLLSSIINIMDYYLVILGCGVLLAWTLIRCLVQINKKKLQLPPGPFSLPLIGNLHNILGAGPAHQSLWKLAQKYGPIMSIRLGYKTTVVISSSAVAKEAFKNHDLALSGKSFKDAVQAQNHHLFSIVWLPFASNRRRNLRKILYSCISSGNRLVANEHLRSSKIKQLVDYCRRCSQTGETVDIGLAASDTAINILSNTIFSSDLVDLCTNSEKKYKHVIRDMTYQVGKLNIVDFFPVLKRIGVYDPQGINRHTSSCFDQMFKIFGSFIDQRLEQRNKLSQLDRSTNDVLDVLLNMSEEDANAMDRKQILHFCLDLFVAGTDSSSALVEWAMVELMKNPNAMKKAKAELAQVLIGKSKGSSIEEADVARLPYLQCILKETLRLHPPIPLLSRKAEQDVQLCSYLVPKGSSVLVNVWSMGRDPAVWEDPLAFKPERFWGSDMDVRGHDFELIPFGVGRRRCAGLPLALRTIPTMLGSLLNSFDWIVEGDNNTASKDLDVEEKFGLVLAKSRPLRLVPISL